MYYVEEATIDDLQYQGDQLRESRKHVGLFIYLFQY